MAMERKKVKKTASAGRMSSGLKQELNKEEGETQMPSGQREGSRGGAWLASQIRRNGTVRFPRLALLQQVQ
jgi:hypothetical protein